MAIILSLLAIATTAVIIAGIFVSDNVSLSSDGLTGKQKAEAVNISLSDNLVAMILENNGTVCHIGEVRRPGTGYYTYTNGSRTLAIVPIDITNDYGKTNLSITVDLDNMKAESIYFNESSGDITPKLQMDAIKLAINDTSVREWLNDRFNTQTFNYRYIVSGVHPSGFGEYGYVSPFGFYVDVPLRIDSSMPMAVKYLVVTVNLADNTTVIKKQSFGEQSRGSVIDATILPRQYFYIKYYIRSNSTFSNYPVNDITSINMIFGQQPEGANIRPIVVDEDNFRKLCNNSTFDELIDAKLKTYGSKWSIRVPGNSDIYLVLKNEDPKNAVNVTVPPYRIF